MSPSQGDEHARESCERLRTPRRPVADWRSPLQVVHARCCGLDVHKKTVVACVLLTKPTGQVEREVRTFGTMTADWLALSDWLSALDVTQVAMESTGVLWRPVDHLLEDDARTLILVNPLPMRAVPGRQTAVKDSEWLAD